MDHVAMHLPQSVFPSLPPVFVFLEPPTVLLVSNKEGNGSHSVD